MLAADSNGNVDGGFEADRLRVEERSPQRQTVRLRRVFLLVFVAAVVAMSVKDGASGAVMTALLAVVVAAMAVGVWGTAMAVRDETQDPRD